MWYDTRLQWDPKDYDDIASTRVTADELWTPENLANNE